VTQYLSVHPFGLSNKGIEDRREGEATVKRDHLGGDVKLRLIQRERGRERGSQNATQRGILLTVCAPIRYGRHNGWLHGWFGVNLGRLTFPLRKEQGLESTGRTGLAQACTGWVSQGREGRKAR